MLGGFAPSSSAAIAAAVVHARPGLTHIDLGSGDGRVCAAFAAAGCHTLGIEHDLELVEKCRRRYPHLTFVHADAWDETWDADVITVSGIEDPVLRDRIVQKADQGSPPGAVLIFL